MIAWPKLARLARPFGTVMFPRTLFGKLPTRHQQGDLCPVWSARAATKKWDWKAVQITALQWTCHYEYYLKDSIHINSFSNCEFFYMHQHIKTICFMFCLSSRNYFQPVPGKVAELLDVVQAAMLKIGCPMAVKHNEADLREQCEFLWKGFDMIEDIIWVESMVIVDNIYNNIYCICMNHTMICVQILI